MLRRAAPLLRNSLMRSSQVAAAAAARSNTVVSPATTTAASPATATAAAVAVRHGSNGGGTRSSAAAGGGAAAAGPGHASTAAATEGASSAAQQAAGGSEAESAAGAAAAAQAEPPVGDGHKKLWELPATELVYICLIFAVTGSTAAIVVRYLLAQMLPSDSLRLPADSSFRNGPIHFWVLYVMVMMPTYSTLVLTFGTLAGRRGFFSRLVVKMWKRVLPKSALLKLQSVIVPGP